MKYVCELCGLVYDEASGYANRNIAPGTAFASLPDDFSCPGCGSEKEAFCAAGQKQTVSTARDNQFWQGVKYSDQGGESDR